jgi:antitoxin (DNA-binding transcriptional repressor) of toxin-antitoxin stability system
MTVSEARAALPHVLDLVERGEEVTLTRHGKPVAVVVRPDVLRARRAAAAMAKAREIGELLEQARTEPLPDLTKGGLAPGRADELVAAIRADRDAE